MEERAPRTGPRWEDGMSKILVVDDERDVEVLITQRFRRAVRAGELQFLFAHDGDEALAALRSDPDIDMVLSDINMPGMDGLTLLDHLPKVNADVRAVMVSAYDDLGNVRAAMNRGAFDFITKPIDFADLEATIRKTLAVRQAERELRDALFETRAAEAASREQAARLRRVLDGSPIGVFIAAEDGDILYSNRQCTDLFGLSPEEMRERGAAALYSHIMARKRLLARLRRGRPIRDEEVSFTRPDGSTVWVILSFDQTRYEGRVVFVVWVYDITERKAQAEALRAAKDAAESALADLERMQEDLIRAEKMAVIGQLIAAVAHEVNTPVGVALTAATHLMTVSNGISDTFRDGLLRRTDFEGYLDTAREVACLLVTNIERAVALIQSLKLVTEGRASMPRGRFDLKEYLEDILLAVRVQPVAVGHELRLDCPKDLVLDTYPGTLTEVLLSLLTNAFNHAFEPGRSGRIVISVSMLPNERVELRVSDNGRGIPREILPRLFEPFATTRRGSGSIGLGLYAAFNLVTDKLHGEIRAESEPGRGACFILRLPIDAPAEAPPAGAMAATA